MNQNLRIYLDFLKIRIGGMVALTTAFGYLLGAQGHVSFWHLSITLVGTALSGMGAAVLNNYIEADLDAKMNRTSCRAIPMGLITRGEALGLGLLLTIVGVSLLAWQINLLTGFLAILTSFIYVLIYTPLKRVTWLNTLVGAIPGALPTMGGWTAATGQLDLGAWLMFAILFVWQLPHFYAIAWIYREDYERGGFKMLSVVDPKGERIFTHIVVTSAILLPVAMLPSLFHLAGGLYCVGALIVSLVMLSFSVELALKPSIAGARQLFLASLVFLPTLLLLVITEVGV